MSNYAVSTNFGAKDALISGNPAKIILGAQLTTEFNALVAAIATKIDGIVVFAPDGTAVQPSYGFTNNGGTGMYNAAGLLGFATGGVAAMTISAAGAVIVTRPTSGQALTVNGVTGSITLQLKPATSAEVALQILDPGANATQLRLNTTNTAVNLQALGTTTNLVVSTSAGVALTLADGQGAFVGAAAGGGQGAGTLNAVGLYVAGNPVYAGIPQNIQATNYTFVLADANKHVYQNAGGVHTYTIPANASVAFPIGTAITGINGHGAGNITLNITTDNLIWSPSGATGSRTIAADGVFTLLKVAAASWYITGSGIT